MTDVAHLTIARESPIQAEFLLLFARHTEAMHAETPPGSIHMMDAGTLDHPGIAFYVMRDGGRPLAMGALKRIDAGHAEIKSMHVLAEVRGRGLARLMLDHLIAEARAAGFRRVSLETGVQPGFVAARTLYAKAGFTECLPFEGYWDDPSSVFMTRVLE